VSRERADGTRGRLFGRHPLVPRGTNVLLARILFGLGAVTSVLLAVWAFQRWLARMG